MAPNADMVVYVILFGGILPYVTITVGFLIHSLKTYTINIL